MSERAAKVKTQDDHLAAQRKRVGREAAKRILEARGGKIIREVTATQLVGQLGEDRSLFIQIKNYSSQPHASLGLITGCDDREIERLRDATFEYDAVMTMFIDCVVGIAFWATYGQLMERGGEFEDVAGRKIKVPFERFKHGQPGANYTQQWLWPVLWFKELGQFAELTDGETSALRKCRIPRTDAGLARLGFEDEERMAFNRFEAAWRARRGQGSLF